VSANNNLATSARQQIAEDMCSTVSRDTEALDKKPRQIRKKEEAIIDLLESRINMVRVKLGEFGGR